jgi:alanine-alpha-ketoisovalerate/valine-pyruvate aminotransferase
MDKMQVKNRMIQKEKWMTTMTRNTMTTTMMMTIIKINKIMRLGKTTREGIYYQKIIARIAIIEPIITNNR